MWKFRACEGSAGCASTVDYSESFVGTLLLLVRVVVGGVAGAQKLVRGVACRRGVVAEGAASYFVHTHLFLWLGLCNSRPWHPRERDADVAKAHRAGTLMNLIIFIKV